MSRIIYGIKMKDKENTKRKLIKAVGEVIKVEGFQSLKISKISQYANVDRKLIYRYFGNLNYLIEAYILENDYWMVFSNNMKQMLADKEAEYNPPKKYHYKKSG